MFPWRSLVFALPILAIAASCDPARRLSEPVIVDGVDVSAVVQSLVESPNPPDLATLVASLPPGVNLTEIAAKLPEETKAELMKKVMENGNNTAELTAVVAANGGGTPISTAAPAASGTGNPDLSALAGSSISEMKLPDMPNVEIPNFSMPSLPPAEVHLFGHSFDLSSFFGGKS